MICWSLGKASSSPSIEKSKEVELLTGLRLLSFFVVVTCATTFAVDAQTYSVTEIGTFGGSFSKAEAINDLGQVTGLAAFPPNNMPRHAFLWVNGTMTDLGTLGGSRSMAYGINNQTQVVGESQVGGGGGQHAFLWEDGVMMELSTPDGPAGSAYDINDAGQITGIANAGFAYIWQDGDMIDLGTLPGMNESAGFAIDAAGEVVGPTSCGFFCPGNAFHWVDGEMFDLGRLPGFDGSVANCINDTGMVAGYSTITIPSTLRATLWDSGEIIDLGAGDGIYSEVLGINNPGVVVGYWGTSEQFVHHYATKWVDGELIDLNDEIPADSGWQLAEARDINEVGQIVGFGFNPDGLLRGFLLTPCDFSGGPGEDCDGNGVPDECQLDCNDNGQPDVCDIAEGVSGDCDGDNTPNECDPGPPFTQQPADQEVQEGDFAFFIVEADGSSLEHQWRKDGVDLIDTERIIGSQTSMLFIVDVQSTDAGEYDCVVTDTFNSACSVSDPAALTVIVTCPPDFDCDGDVDAADLAELLGNWGPCPEPCTPDDAETCPADFDHDCHVTAADLAQLLGNWGDA